MSETKLQEQINQLVADCDTWEIGYHKARMQAIGLRRALVAVEKRNKELVTKLKALEKDEKSKNEVKE